MKTYNPQQTKYKYNTLTNILNRIFNTKQEEDESLYYYKKRFKETKESFKMLFGTDVLHDCIEHTKQYQDMSNSSDKTIIKNESFEMWMAYLYLFKSDQSKNWNLLKGFKPQFSLDNDQYPKTCSRINDVLTNHRWDKKYK